MTRISNRDAGTSETAGPAERFFARIRQSGALPPDVTPESAASAVLCVLARRLPGGEVADMRQALPGPRRDLFQSCPRHRRDPPETFDREEFLRRVGEHLGIPPDQAETVARTVFAALQEEVPSVRQEVDDVESQLPRDLKELWRPRLAH